MKKNKNIKLFLLLAVPIFLGSFLTFVKVSNAQGACTVLPPVFRTTKPGGPSSSTFYQETDRPFVYIDIHTQNCMNQTIRLTLWGGGDQVDVMDDKPFTIGPDTGNSSDFTIPMRAGEENCDFNTNPDCSFHLSIQTPSSATPYQSNILLQYNCDGATCLGADWQIFNVLPVGSDLGGTGGIDTHGSVGVLGGIQGTGGGATPTGTPGSGNTSSSASTTINLNIVNPLAGTVDTIPQLFQTIVNIIISIAIPLVAMAIVYSGLLFVTARGDTAQLEKARQAFTYAVIGGLILLASWLIAEAIKDALTSLAYVM
jgi:hypothetical protein